MKSITVKSIFWFLRGNDFNDKNNNNNLYFGFLWKFLSTCAWHIGGNNVEWCSLLYFILFLFKKKRISGKAECIHTQLLCESIFIVKQKCIRVRIWNGLRYHVCMPENIDFFIYDAKTDKQGRSETWFVFYYNFL